MAKAKAPSTIPFNVSELPEVAAKPLAAVKVIPRLASNAAAPVASQDLSKIETPYYPDHDKLIKWASHLAYGQFHNQELISGDALSMLTK